MTTEQLLELIAARGLRVVLLPDGRPALRGDRAAATPALLAALKWHREELVRRAAPDERGDDTEADADAGHQEAMQTERQSERRPVLAVERRRPGPEQATLAGHEAERDDALGEVSAEPGDDDGRHSEEAGQPGTLRGNESVGDAFVKRLVARLHAGLEGVGVLATDPDIETMKLREWKWASGFTHRESRHHGPGHPSLATHWRYAGEDHWRWIPPTEDRHGGTTTS